MSLDTVAAASTIAPLIMALRAETESERQLPKRVVDALTEARLWRTVLPSDLDGGLELDPVLALEVYEALAKAEASVAWVVWNNSLPCFFGRFLGAEGQREIFGDRSWKYAVSTRPTGRGEVRNGSYRLSGRWALVSGCKHADWLALMHVVVENGQPQMVAPGVPNVRVAYVRTADCNILDTWHVGGLRGTGSHDVVVDNVDVPASRTVSPMDPGTIDRPIGRLPIICTMCAGHAALCLGIAQAVTDSVISLARTKASVDPGPGMRDRSATQIAVATAPAKLAALRAQLHHQLGKLWQMAQAGTQPSGEDIADMWAIGITTSRECRALVADLYELAGTTALYTDSILERCHRDIHAALQHVVAQRAWLEDAGRVRFGLAPINPQFLL